MNQVAVAIDVRVNMSRRGNAPGYRKWTPCSACPTPRLRCGNRLTPGRLAAATAGERRIRVGGCSDYLAARQSLLSRATADPSFTLAS